MGKFQFPEKIHLKKLVGDENSNVSFFQKLKDFHNIEMNSKF